MTFAIVDQKTYAHACDVHRDLLWCSNHMQDVEVILDRQDRDIDNFAAFEDARDSIRKAMEDLADEIAKWEAGDEGKDAA